MMWGLLVVAKSTVVLVAAAVLLGVLQRSSAAARHVVCVCTLAALLGLPLLTVLMPQWRVALLPASATTTLSVATVAGQTQLAQATPPTNAQEVLSGPGRSSGIARLPLVLWGTGALLVLGWLLTGRAVLQRVRRRAVSVRGAWGHTLSEEGALLDVRAVTLLFSSDVTAPVTWGILRATIVLPAGALEWNEERQRVVLRHELAHVARRDALTQLIAGITCALYWWHPGMWWLSRRLRVERETACDDVVLAGGMNGASYAHHLLDVARAARALHATSMVSIAFASPSSFERRLMSVLDETTVRQRRRLPRVYVPASLAALLAISAFQPVPRPPQLVSPQLQQPSLPAPQLPPPVLETPRIAPPALAQPATSRSADAPRDTTVHFRVREGGTLYFTLNAGGTIDVTGNDDDMVVITAAGNSNVGGRMNLRTATGDVTPSARTTPATATPFPSP